MLFSDNFFLYNNQSILKFCSFIVIVFKIHFQMLYSMLRLHSPLPCILPTAISSCIITVLHNFHFSLDSSKQRTRLRKKLTSEKKTLQKLIDEYNKVNASTAEEPLTFEGVISGELLDNADNSSGK